MESKLEKGVSGIRVGPVVGRDRGGTEYDYSHLLSPENRAAGYSLSVHHAKNAADEMDTLMAYVGHKNDPTTPHTPPGFLQTFIHPKGLKVDHANLGTSHRGKGLGTSMYEAVYAHAKNRLGIDRAIGGVHSSLAHAAHQRLAQKHGFNYRAKQIAPEANHGEYDEAYNKYSYALKSEDFIKSENQDHSADGTVAADMMGFEPVMHASFLAACFLAGGVEIAPDAIRAALYENDGNMDHAALSAYGIPVTEENVQALHAVRQMQAGDFQKSDPVVCKATIVMAPFPEGQDVAEAIRRAYKDEFVFQVILHGKHSNGAMFARDEQTKKTYLLKPGSGSAGAVAGAKEEKASQAARESAFYQVAKEWGLFHWYPRCELVSIDGGDYAAMDLLPFSYKTLEKRKETDPTVGMRALQPLRDDGILHQLAFIDAVLGDGDAHSNNCMISDDDDVRLIDKGSAFAGSSFDPANDRSSFVPAILRIWAPKCNFNKLTPQEKLKYMPEVSAQTAQRLGKWVASLSEPLLEALLTRYGINPQPSVDRLAKLKAEVAASRIDLAVNRFWAGLLAP